MQTGKVNQRILSFMEKRGMDITALSEAAGLDPQFIKTMLDEDAYPPPWAFNENCPGTRCASRHLSG
ncbi:hypothetical protein [Desulfobacter sp. UBA2225]|uniref:hypothetical protein n=1 Tax=Desulfobacter sp. UBA2225 TaxID=1961413 RepID=UPI0032E44547